MDGYGSYYPPFPIYTEGNCPDTLAWDKEIQFCSLECLYPVYKDAEIESLFIVDRVLAIIGFILCYFYCFTSLFRHKMLEFPNSTIFFLFFSQLLTTMSILIPFILGSRYVFCDTNTSPGADNWACIICGNYYLIIMKN